MIKTDILIIGAGIAGISAAKAACAAGRSVIIADREEGYGGVLCQCMHRGFGSGLTGPEYIAQLMEDFPENVEAYFSTTVLEICKDKSALLSNRELGIFEIAFSQLILAAGCMEISPGMLPIGGTRPDGVYTAGHAQLMSFMGESFESPLVILGSGDLGLIMANQLTQQGHEVSCIVEKKSSPTAMARNRGILDTVPLITNSSVYALHGAQNLESITLVNLQSGEMRQMPCKTLLVAAGLKPDRSLARGIENEPWLTYCGNCLKIYPMVEGLAADAKEAAKAVCERNW